MPCHCGRTCACDACNRKKERIRQQVAAGARLIQIRGEHLVLAEHSASLCGIRGLPVGGEMCSRETVPEGTCERCKMGVGNLSVNV